MASYETVEWQPQDEATTQKLDQMCKNTDWIKERLIVGNINYIPNALGTVAGGRTASIEGGTKFEAVSFPFDSQVPVLNHQFTMPIPPGVFTDTPIATFAYNANNDFCIMHMSDVNTTGATFRICQKDGLIMQFTGVVHVHLFGK